MDQVNHPKHYISHPSGVECIDITQHMGFLLGNAVKYVWRHTHKGNPREDLEKALWYTKRARDICPSEPSREISLPAYEKLSEFERLETDLMIRSCVSYLVRAEFGSLKTRLSHAESAITCITLMISRLQG